MRIYMHRVADKTLLFRQVSGECGVAAAEILMEFLCSRAAPEVVGRQRYGRPVDCWATGVIMYIL